MVCPNCKSKDIVSIQGQHYCLNCGQLVPNSAVPKSAPPVAPDLAEKIAGTPLKIVGAATEETSVASATAVIAAPPKTTTASAVSAPPKVAIRIATRRRINENATSIDKPTKLFSTKPAVGQPVTPKVIPSPAPAVVEKSTPSPDTKLAASKPTPKTGPTPFVTDVVAVPAVDSIKPPVQTVMATHAARPTKSHGNHNFHTILVTLSALVTVSLFALAVTVGPDPILQIWTWLYAGIPTVSWSLKSLEAAGIVIGLGFLVYLLLVLAQAALSFIRVRQSVNRPVKDSLARRAAQASFLSILGIDIRIGFWVLCTAILELGLIRYVSAVAVSLPAAEPYLLAAGTLIILYYASALLAARNLAVVSNTVAGGAPKRSLHRGWQLYNRHTIDIVAGELVALVYSLLFLLPAFVSWLILKLTPGDSSLRPTLTGMWLVLTALSIYLITNYGINFWSEVYADAASSLPPEQSAVLLGGRKITTSKRPAMLIASLTIACIAAIAIGAWYTGWAAHLSGYFHDWLIR